MPSHWLRQPGLFHEFHQPELCGIVTIFRLGLTLCDHAGAGLQHRDRTDFALVIEQLRHADFLS
jgi:hypothetical protein